MKRMHGPSLLLGLGVGLVLAALMGILLSPLLSPSLSDEAVLQRAAALGMVMRPGTGVDGITALADGGWQIDLPADLRVTELAGRLKKAGILEDTLEFEIIARKEGLPQTISAGLYVLPSDAGAREAVTAFLARPEASAAAN